MIYEAASKRPILMIVLALIIGIILSDQFSMINFGALSATLVGLLIPTYVLRFKPLGSYLLFVSFILIGAILQVSYHQNSTCENINDYDRIPLRISSIKKKLKYDQLYCQTTLDSERIGVLVNVKVGSDEQYTPGDLIIVSANLYKPSSARIPNGFNYRSFLNKKNIQWICYVDAQDIFRYEAGGASISTIITVLNNKMMSRVNSVFQKSQHLDLIKGIILGYKEDMAKEDRDLYGMAGIGHVFAVSGMHVGMVYVLFFPLLFFRNRNTFTKFGLPVLALFGVWAFVLASGATPSAVRAGMMISLYELSKILYRRADKWNILAISALISLIVQPLVLFDLGFQFSYLALTGIFYFYSKFTKAITSKYLVLKWILNLIMLSVAAQLTLAPLTLYYFGSISPYFWLTSLVATVTVQVNFILAFISLIFNPDSPQLAFLIAAIDYGFDLLVAAIRLIMELPYAVYSMKLTPRSVFVCYTLILMFAICLQSIKWVNKIRLGACIAIIALLFDIVTSLISPPEHVKIFNDEGFQVQVYSGFNHTPILMGSAEDVALYGDHTIDILSQTDTILHRETSILLLDQPFIDETVLDSLPSLAHIIATPTCSYKTKSKLKKYCSQHHLLFNQTNDGFITINL